MHSGILYLMLQYLCISADISQDTGEVLVHFDGWTDKYDYWTMPDSTDLHPIGYMDQKAKDHPNLNPKLNIPNGE